MLRTNFRSDVLALGLLAVALVTTPYHVWAQSDVSPAPRPTATATPTLSKDSTYFGAKTSGAPVITEGKGSSGIAMPPPAAPVLTRPTTGYGAGIGGASTTPAPTPVATVAETPSAAALTPVGKWHWHAGGDHTLTDKGAIIQGTKVVGQWKWLDKTKSQIQVQWTGGPYRPPMTYTLSPHGNHLSGKSPSSGQDHTEERAE